MSAKIRLVSVFDDFTVGGDEMRLLEFASSIDRSGFEHTVLLIQRGAARNEASTAMRSQFAAANIEVIDLDFPNALEAVASTRSRYVRSASRLVRKIYRLTKALRRMDVDIVDAHAFTGGLIGAVAGWVAGCPTTVTLYEAPNRYGALWHNVDSRWERALYNLVGQLTFIFCKAVITDSVAAADTFKRWMWYRKPVFVIPNGVRTPTAQRSRAEMRRHLGIPDARRRVIGQIAGLERRKGHTVLFEAAARVLREAPDVFFLIVGYERDPFFKDFLERRVAELGIGGSVAIVSYPGRIGDVWSVIDIHVHSSLGDSLPNAIMEGMSFALPAVVTSVGGIPEMVTHQVTGLIVPPNDAVALGDAILHLLQHPDEAAALGEAGYRRYCERYRTEVMTRALERVFESLAQTTKAVPRRAAG